MKIDRQQFLQEMKVRKFIRKGIELYFEKKEQENNKAVLEEQKLRSIIRDLIKETATPDNDPAPAKSTGINVLEDLLKKIIPVLEIDYKKLTSDKAQRDSFRAHIVKGVEDVLAPPKALNKAGEAEEDPGFMDYLAGLKNMIVGEDETMDDFFTTEKTAEGQGLNIRDLTDFFIVDPSDPAAVAIASATAGLMASGVGAPGASAAQ